MEWKKNKSSVALLEGKLKKSDLSAVPRWRRRKNEGAWIQLAGNSDIWSMNQRKT